MSKRLILAKLENVMSAIRDLNSIKDLLPKAAKQKLLPLKEAYLSIKPEFDKFRKNVKKK